MKKIVKLFNFIISDKVLLCLFILSFWFSSIENYSFLLPLIFIFILFIKYVIKKVKFFSIRKKYRMNYIPKIYKNELDVYYRNIIITQIGLYQFVFNKILSNVNIENYSNYFKNLTCNEELIKKENDKINNYLKKQPYGIDAGYIICMIYQYFYADIKKREEDKDLWVTTVVHRNINKAYFPSGYEIWEAHHLEWIFEFKLDLSIVLK